MNSYTLLLLTLSTMLLLACASQANSTPSDPAGDWHTEPSMRNARAAHAVVSTGSAIYALAGTGTGRQPVLEVERFDGKEWVVETTLPEQGLNAPTAVILTDRIYVIGGFNTVTNIPSDQVHVYDLDTQTWSETTPLPNPRGGHASVVLDGKIHVLGGGNSRSTIADHTVYDPATQLWSELAPLPRDEGSPAAVVFSGKIYAIGGRSGHSDFGDVYIYDPTTDTWNSGPSIEPRGTAGAVVYCGAIYLFGGESQKQAKSLGDVFRLDEQSGTWQPMKPMPTARNFARAVLFGDSVYVVGGSPEAGSSHASEGSAVVERFEVVCSQ